MTPLELLLWIALPAFACGFCSGVALLLRAIGDLPEGDRRQIEQQLCLDLPVQLRLRLGP